MRPRGKRRAVQIGSVVVAIGLAGALAARVSTIHSGRIETVELESPSSAQEFGVLKLVNDERKRAGIEPLQFSRELLTAARRHSRDMAAHHYLGHDSPAGDSPADRVRAAGLPYEEVGENVYADEHADANGLAERTVKAWMQSPAHRANLLSPGFRGSAAAISRSPDGRYYVTEDFIR